MPDRTRNKPKNVQGKNGRSGIHKEDEDERNFQEYIITDNK